MVIEWKAHCHTRITGPRQIPARSESGGIGRRAGLRSRCLRTWGFESPLSHAVMSRGTVDRCRGA